MWKKRGNLEGGWSLLCYRCSSPINGGLRECPNCGAYNRHRSVGEMPPSAARPERGKRAMYVAQALYATLLMLLTYNAPFGPLQAIGETIETGFAATPALWSTIWLIALAAGITAIVEPLRILYNAALGR